MKNKVKNLFAAFLFASVLMMLVSCSKPEGVKVNVEKPQIKEVEVRSQIELSVKPTDKITVVSEVYGVVESINVEIGSIVDSGDILIALDTSGAESEVAHLQSEYDIMVKQVMEIENSLDLMGEDADDAIEASELETETVSRSDLVSRLSESQKNLDEVKSKLDKLKMHVKDSNVYSPIRGVITRIAADKGKFVQSMTGIVEISDFSKLELRTKVKREDISGLYVGDVLSLEVDGKGELESKIEAMKMVDRKKNIYQVKLEADNYDYKIKSYGETKASIATGKRRIMYISKESLLEDDGGSYVFCIEDEKAVKKYVDTVQLKEGVEIKDGIGMTDVVVYDPDESIEDGVKVDAIDVTAEQ